LLSTSKTKLQNNIIQCGQIEQIFYMLIYHRFLGALLLGLTGSLPRFRWGHRSPYTLKLPLCLYTPLDSRIIAWGSVTDRRTYAGFCCSKKVEKHWSGGKVTNPILSRNVYRCCGLHDTLKSDHVSHQAWSCTVHWNTRCAQSLQRHCRWHESRRRMWRR